MIIYTWVIMHTITTIVRLFFSQSAILTLHKSHSGESAYGAFGPLKVTSGDESMTEQLTL